MGREWRLRRSRSTCSSMAEQRLRQAVKEWGGSQPSAGGVTNW